MRLWIVVVTILGSVVLGAAGGYAGAAMSLAAGTPFASPSEPPGRGFDGVVEDFARLGGYESVAANCSGSVDTTRALKMEAEAIHDLEQRGGSDASLLHLAEAKRLVRTLSIAAKNSQTDGHSEVQRAQDLLKDAGWREPSEVRMREILRDLDQDQCRTIVLGGAQ